MSVAQVFDVAQPGKTCFMSADSVANPGVVRPPAVHGICLFAGLVAEGYWPMHALLYVDLRLPGLFSFLGAVTVFFLARFDFKRVGTPIPGNRPTTALVVSGIFKWSRNPIYLSFGLLHLSVVFWTLSFWLVLGLVVSLLVVDRVVIRREESYMEQKFGTAYTNYKSGVRRWI